MRAELKIVMDGCVDHLRTVWQSAEGFFEAIPFAEDPVQTRYNLLVALQELITNSLRHGYGETDPDCVWLAVNLKVENGRLSVEIRDRAPAFNPTLVLDEPEVGEDGQIPEGGYGLMIVQQVVDQVSYDRDGDENVLSLEKSVSSASAPVL